MDSTAAAASAMTFQLSSSWPSGTNCGEKAKKILHHTENLIAALKLPTSVSVSV
jgi:hypothetical protein